MKKIWNCVSGFVDSEMLIESQYSVVHFLAYLSSSNNEYHFFDNSMLCGKI